MSSLSRMLAILDLFTEATPVWSAEGIVQQLGYSRPTGYRYLRELCAAGLLVRLSGGAYHLGPRIIELDWHIRSTDPVLRAGQQAMRELADKTGCHVLLSRIYGTRILHVHHEPGVDAMRLVFARGVPLPLFRGATAKAIVAHLPRERLQRLYATHRQAIAAAWLGRSWEEFRDEMADVRRAGYVITDGELDPQASGIAVPVFGDGTEPIGALTLVTLHRRFALLDRAALVETVTGAARRISAAVGQIAAPDAPTAAKGGEAAKLRRVK